MCNSLWRNIDFILLIDQCLYWKLFAVCRQSKKIDQVYLVTFSKYQFSKIKKKTNKDTNQTRCIFYRNQKIHVNFICSLINSTRLTITPWKTSTSDLFVYMHINSVELFYPKQMKRNGIFIHAKFNHFIYT